MFWFGLLLTIALWARKVPAALLISILVTTVVAILDRRPAAADDVHGDARASRRSASSTSPTSSPCSARLAAVLTIFSFMLTDFFDTMGTATAISEQAGLVEEEGQPEDIGRILLVDSVGAAVGGAAGISSNTSYIESAAGVAEGGRTGLHLGRDRAAVPRSRSS